MTGYFISNTFRFFQNGEIFIPELLGMVKRYDNENCLEEQVEIIFCIFSKEILDTVNYIKYIPSELEAWKEIQTVIDTWEDAWIEIVSVNADYAKNCKNPTIKNFATIIS